MAGVSLTGTPSPGEASDRQGVPASAVRALSRVIVVDTESIEFCQRRRLVCRKAPHRPCLPARRPRRAGEVLTTTHKERHAQAIWESALSPLSQTGPDSPQVPGDLAVRAI